jgi:HKD family nuclease
MILTYIFLPDMENPCYGIKNFTNLIGWLVSLANEMLLSTIAMHDSITTARKVKIDIAFRAGDTASTTFNALDITNNNIRGRVVVPLIDFRRANF